MEVTHEVGEASRSLIDSVSRLHRRGWCDGTGGNFSLVLKREPLRLLMTPSGADKGRLTPEMLLQVGAQGQILDDPGGGSATPERRPSAESELHLALVRSTGAGAVLHTHSIWATLLGQRHRVEGRIEFSGYEMQKGIDGVQSHEQTVALPIVDNSQDMALLAANIESAVSGRPAARGILIAGHGLYAWGGTLGQAHRHVEIYEFLLELTGRRAALPPLGDRSSGSI